MKNAKLVYHICNLALGVLFVVYITDLLHIIPFPFHLELIHLFIAIIMIQIVKYWIESKYEFSDPIKSNKSSNTFYYLSFGVLALGILLKIKHWPFASILLVGAAILNLISIVISFVKNNENNVSDNTEILDDEF